jgi:apolipoprotein N-acyltransferase
MTPTKDDLAAAAPRELGRLVGAIDAPVLVGLDRFEYKTTEHSVRSTNADPAAIPDSASAGPRLPTPSQAYNSAALVGRDGQIIGTYDKFHLVMFGEYVPFSRWLPFLKQITTLTGSVDAGAGPVSLLLDDTVYSPNICYETVIPHVIRRQINTLHGGTRRPDVLVNMTNDAWYWGSNELEQHLACGVFRSIETRRPLAIAANGGISAWIDHTGRIRAQSPKQQPDMIIADVQKVYETSYYLIWGDWFAAVCLTGGVILAIVGWKARKHSHLTPDT